MNRKIAPIVAFAAAVASAAATFAHGPQLQLTADGSRIVTREILIDTYHPVAPEKSIYVLPVADLSSAWVIQPPGTLSSGPGIAPGVGFVDAASHPFKSGTGNFTTSFADGLKKWNGASFVDASAAQMQLYKTVSGNPLTATSTDNGPFAGLAYNLTINSQQSHTDMGYRFLGDGSPQTSLLDDGVYLLTLKVTHQPPSAAPLESDPFYFVLPKGVSPSEAGDATFALALEKGFANNRIQAMTAIPEPASCLLAAMALLPAARRIRRALRS